MTAHPRVNGEGTVPAGIPGPPRAAAAHALVAVTRDPALSRALQDLAAEHTIHLVEDLRQLTDRLLQHAAGIALLDAAALDAPVDAVVDAIDAQFPDLRLMVAGHGQEQNLLTSRIAEGAVFRFVHKPASPQRLKLFLDAAVRSGERRRTPPAESPTILTPAPVRAGAAPRGPAPGMLAIGTVAALLVAGLAAWLLWPGSERSVPGTASRAMPVAPPPMAEPEAQAFETALRDAEEALLAGRLEDAGTALARANQLDPDNPRLSFLSAQIVREAGRMSAEAAQREAITAQALQLRAAREQLDERSRREEQPAEQPVAGRDVAPAAPQPADTGTEPADAGDAPAGPAYSPASSSIAASLSIAPAPAAATSSAPAISAPATPPPPAPAPAGPLPGEGIVPEGTLKRLRKVDPEYPAEALQRLVSGWVEMEFTVAKDGSVKDIEVKAAQPRRTFDGAAVAALRRFRYAPVLRDGQPVEQRALVRMRFAAEER